MISAAIGTAFAGLYVPSLPEAFTTNDFPTWAVAKGVSSGSLVRVTVEPTGRVSRCEDVSFVGDPILAKVACNVLNGKRLKPATLSNGAKVHATGVTMIKFTIPDTAEGKRIDAIHLKPDAEIIVNRLPKKDPDVSINLSYDSAGNVIDCAPTQWEKDKSLAEMACSQRSIFDGAIFKDSTGQPVPYVTWKRVRFTVASQK